MLNHFNQNLFSMMESLEDRVLFDGVPDATFILPVGQSEAIPESVQAQAFEQADFSMPREVVFIDAGVENSDQLLESILASRPESAMEIRILDASTDGVQQISKVLSEAKGSYDAIHVISHGNQGEVYLGSTTLDEQALSAYADEIAGWSEALADDADVLFYGCNLAGNEAGESFIESVAALTGADVAASDDLTGNQELGGDWDLEFQIGQVDAASLHFVEYGGLLDLTITAATGTADVTNTFNNNFVGDGISASGLTQIGSFDQFGTFVNNASGLGTSILPVADGLVIVTGDVTSAASAAGNTIDAPGATGFFPETNGISTFSTANASDSDLVALTGGAIFDAGGFDFDFQAATDRIAFVFSFASDEYPEFVGTPFNDGFGFFIQGGTDYLTTTNLAIVPGTTDGIAVNTINPGFAGASTAWAGTAPFVATNNAQYIDNSMHDPTSTTVDPYLEYDGLTVLLSVEADLTRNTLYDMKIAIGDAGDGGWDSAVFFRTNGFIALSSATDNEYSVVEGTSISGNIITDDTGDDVDVTPNGDQAGLDVTAINGTATTGGTIILPSGATLTIAQDGSYTYDASTLPPFTGASFVDSFTYEITDATGVTDTATVTITVLADKDGDGVANVDDIDDDNDGILDINEGVADTDGDGVLDHCDLDSDNDGISDLVESGASVAIIAADTNNDGTISAFEAAAANGGIADADGDGLMDIFDADITLGNTDADSVGTIPVDTDSTSGTADGIADYLDLDSDNDGIGDATEARASADYVAYTGSGDAADTDDDGILDIYDTATDAFGFAALESNDAFVAGSNTANADADDTADSTPDYLDTDSDGDLIDDSVEAGTIATAPTYADPDGSVNDPLGASDGLLNVDSDATDVDFRSLNNQPAVLDLNSAASGADTDRNWAAEFVEGSATPVSIADIDSGIADVDDTNMESGLVTFTNPQANDIVNIGATEVFNNGVVITPTVTIGGITYNVSLGGGGELVIAMTGTETLANYADGIEAITFENDGSSPDTTDRVFEVTVNDGNEDSNVATSTITVLLDKDGDGVADRDDVDDDNDGILDVEEGLIEFTEGWEDPVQPNVNGDNIVGPTFGNWYTENGSSINVIRVDGTGYAAGPDNASDGSQYVDLLGSDFLMYDFQISAAGTAEISADFSNREPGNAAYQPWTAQVEILDSSMNVVASGTSIDFTAATSEEPWFTSSLTTGLAAGAYHVRMFVSDYGHVDNISVNVVVDSDGDGVSDHCDLDSDNDGITDNVEAQSTAGYVEPIGVDANMDGLDDAYDNRTVTVGTAAATQADVDAPVDTDGDLTPDYLDTDSDNDGATDAEEAGHGVSQATIDLHNDADGDGLMDEVDAVDNTVTWDVNDDDLDATDTNFNLADSNDNVAADGSDAVALVNDMNFREDQPPVIDLNSAATGADPDLDYTSTFNEGSTTPLNVVDNALADTTEFGEDDLATLTIVVDPANVHNGNDEVVNIGGTNFALETDQTAVVNIGGIDFNVAYVAATGTFTITPDSVAVIPEGDLDDLVQGITYINNSNVWSPTIARWRSL